MSSRSEKLAARIEEGAATLAAFAEQLSDAEWSLPGSNNGKDKRTIGVIINHVASIYPVEIEAARTIASGKAMTEVTWDAIAELNGQHARENATPTKVATLELLQRNSRAAAAAVRSFTDEELDQAAPFGLSYNAPVTAQYVIEDHALRHPWHHLARIRAVVGR